MAFYFRKLGRTIRLVPATKSLGHSTRINEGEKKDDGVCCRNQKRSKVVFKPRKDSRDLAFVPPPSTSLVPLSVRDMALVLMPRLGADVEEISRNSVDKPELFMSVAKKVSFTSDDILPESFNHSDIDQTSILERVVFNAQQPYFNGNDRLYLFDKTNYQAFQHPKTCTEQVLQTDNIFETFMSGCDSQFPAFRGVSLCSSGEGVKEKLPKKPKDGPSAEQLHCIKDKLESLVTMMLSYRYDYSILHRNIIFENRLFGENIVRSGHTFYGLELLRLRFKIHTRFSSTEMEVLNTTVNEDTGVVRIHWRLKGLPQTEMLKFWRLLEDKKDVCQEEWHWFEAFSYFHIGKDGLVHKHVIDRMLPGNEQPDKLSSKLRNILNPAKPLVA